MQARLLASAALLLWPAVVWPQPAPPPLPLETALALARERAPVVRAAQARAEAETAAAGAVGRWRGPTLEASIENLGPRDFDRDAFVWVTQPLDIGARRSTRLAAARASRDALASDVDLQRLSIDVAVADAYLALLQHRETVALLEDHEAAITEVVALLRRRVEEGLSAEGTLRKLEAELARMTLARVRADLDRQQSALTLARLVGEDAATLSARVQLPAAPPVPPASDDVIAAAIERRADVRSARARAAERQAAADMERALGGTALAAMGGYKRTSGLNTATAGIAIDLPIGARNATARLRAEGDARAAAALVDEATRVARADIENSLLRARVLGHQASRLATTLVEPATVAQRAARAAFREGTGDALSLVDADRVYIESRQDALRTQIDAVAAAIRARLALGEVPVP